jgi:hypothetical protein
MPIRMHEHIWPKLGGCPPLHHNGAARLGICAAESSASAAVASFKEAIAWSYSARLFGSLRISFAAVN